MLHAVTRLSRRVEACLRSVVNGLLDIKICSLRSVNRLSRWADGTSGPSHRLYANDMPFSSFLSGRMFTSCTVHGHSDGCMPVLIGEYQSSFLRDRCKHREKSHRPYG